MFSQCVRQLVKFLKAEDGPTAVEYAVMLALIIVVCIAAITTLGSNANSTFSSVGNAIGTGSEEQGVEDAPTPSAPFAMRPRCRRERASREPQLYEGAAPPRVSR